MTRLTHAGGLEGQLIVRSLTAKASGGFAPQVSRNRTGEVDLAGGASDGYTIRSRMHRHVVIVQQLF